MSRAERVAGVCHTATTRPPTAGSGDGPRRSAPCPSGVRLAAVLAACGAVLATLSACGGGGDGSEGGRRGVTVFAAASLTDVFGDIAAAFEEAHPGIDVTLQFAGSSRLATQINAGAPADVFAAADERTAAQVDARQVTTFARNRLAIVTPPDNPAGVSSLALADPQRRAAGPLRP